MTPLFFGRKNCLPSRLKELLRLKHSRSKPKKNNLEESKEWMVKFILPTKETWDIDKYALLLKDERGEREELKMIGMFKFWGRIARDIGEE